MKVSELMSNTVISISPDASTAAAAKLFSCHNIGSAPVIGGDGKIRGIITDRDIVIRCVASENDPETTPVKDVMTHGVFGISPDADVREATELMSTEQIRRVPVIEDGKVIGMVSLGDMAKSNSYQMEASKALTDISMPKKK